MLFSFFLSYSESSMSFECFCINLRDELRLGSLFELSSNETLKFGEHESGDVIVLCFAASAMAVSTRKLLNCGLRGV